jgi:tRNA splicing endonuclease
VTSLTAYWDRGAVTVPDRKHAAVIFENGYFGKGSLSKSKPIGEARGEVLFLTPEETFFLVRYVGCLQLFDQAPDLPKSKARGPMDSNTCWIAFCNSNTRFPERYATYHYFRCKGWLVKCGLKFGSDFLLYEDIPDKVHAAYSAVAVRRPCSPQKKRKRNGSGVFPQPIASWDSLEILSRLTGNAAKSLLVCLVSTPCNLAVPSPGCFPVPRAFDPAEEKVFESGDCKKAATLKSTNRTEELDSTKIRNENTESTFSSGSGSAQWKVTPLALGRWAAQTARNTGK